MKTITIILVTLILIVGCSQSAPKHVSITDQLEKMQTKDGKPTLERRDIALLRATGADFETIDHLLSMKDDKGVNLFKPNDVAWFLRCGGTVEYAESLANIRSKYGHQRFHGKNIAHLRAIGADLDVVMSLINMRSIRGNELFNGHDVIMYLEMGGDTLYARKVLDLFDAYEVNPHGFMRFSSQHPMPLDDLEFYLGIEHLQISTLRHYFEDGGTKEYAAALQNAGYSFDYIYRFNKLNVPVEMLIQSEDTERPNALFLFPQTDRNGEFSSDAAISFFHKLWKEYDTTIRFVWQESNIFDYFDEMYRVDLIVFCGHGNAEAITFNDGYSMIRSDIRDEYDEPQLDTTDTEFENLFAMMPEDGVIFLDACETNRPTKSGRNLYKFIQSIAGGRRVIGAETIFSHEQIVLKNAYPLEIEFLPPPPKEEPDPMILEKSKTIKHLREKK